MNTNENYQIEEIEDAAVKKSNIAKTAGIAAGMGVLGAGAAVAANVMMDHETVDAEPKDTTPATDITTDELMDGATTAAEETTVVIEEHKTNITHKTPPHTEPEPEPEPEPDTTLTVDEQTYVVDEDGNVVGSQTTGTLEGKAYVAIDTDGDNMVDKIGYDVNNNGIIEANETFDLDSTDQISVSSFGQATHTTVHHINTTPEEPVYPEPEIPVDDIDDPEKPGDDIDDINNNLDEDLPEATEDNTDLAEGDDNYENDYADNNDDYNNDADVSDFA